MAIATFIDSSFLVSLIVDIEVTHHQSKEIVRHNLDIELYINQLVIYESVNVICRKWSIKKANILKKWLDNQLAHKIIKLIPISDSIWNQAYTAMSKKYTKSGPNVLDFIHFACMQEYGIKDILTFDHHFTSAGFNILK